VLNQSAALAFNAGGNGALQGLGQALQNIGQEMQERERQKKLIQYQYELEQERRHLAEEAHARDLQREQEAKKAAEKEEKQNATYTGTGFFVNPAGYLITNAHVIEDKTHVAIRDSKGKFFKASVIAQDKENDFALLHAEGSFRALRIVDSDQALKGQHVFTVGYPQISIQGNESKVTDGIINSFSGIRNENNWFQISVPIQGGNSGGPLVNENGEVIGVIVASLNEEKFYSKTGSMPQNVNYAIKSKVLIHFLAAQQISNTIKTKNETSIDAVDRSTVLVIAQNKPLDVPFELGPVDKKAEHATLTQLYPDWKTIIQSADFKKWLKETPSAKDSFASQRASDRATVLENYKQKRKERETLEQFTRCNNEVVSIYPDWPELKKNQDFMEWIASQSQSTKIKLKSLNATDILSVVKLYKEKPEIKLTEIGRVTSIYEQYNYLVFALNKPEYRQLKEVVLLANGKKIKGSVEKTIGTDISVTLNSEDIKVINTEDAVFVVR
jgi:S1-C subfamily serine protease